MKGVTSLMKKRFRLLLVTMFSLILVLAACSGSEESSNGSSSGDNGSDAKEDEVVEIKYFNWDADQTKIEQIIADFEKENPTIKVKSEVLIPGGSAVDNMMRMDVLMSAGEQVDVVSIPNVDQAVLRAANGMFEPLDEFFEKDGIKIKEDYKISATYDGKVYALPHLSNYWYVLLNKDHLDEAGLPVPDINWTWDDFKEYAIKLSKGEGLDKRYGAYFHTWGEYANPMLFAEKSHPYMLDDATSIFDDESFDYWFELRRDLEEAGAVKSFSDVIGAELNYRTEFFNEEASMLMTASWTIADVGNVGQYPHEFKTAFAPVPRMSEDSPVGSTNIAGEFSAIAKSSKNKEASYKFLRYLTAEGSSIRGLSAWNEADGEATVQGLVAGNEDYYDLDSLNNTLFNENVKGAYDSEIAISYGNELKKNVLEAGFTKFMLDGISVDEAKKWMVEEANKIIENNK
jgi:multiple sugar transport system substrate-binding protein